jgi:hypothetical protein
VIGEYWPQPENVIIMMSVAASATARSPDLPGRESSNRGSAVRMMDLMTYEKVRPRRVIRADAPLSPLALLVSPDEHALKPARSAQRLQRISA